MKVKVKLTHTEAMQLKAMLSSRAYNLHRNNGLLTEMFDALVSEVILKLEMMTILTFYKPKTVSFTMTQGIALTAFCTEYIKGGHDPFRLALSSSLQLTLHKQITSIKK